MQLPSRRHRPAARRGQAMVEFAIILPLIALLLVMALDFGRVFFGWVALHNAARIGADFAAGHAYAWDGGVPGYQPVRDRYQEQILNDLQSLNCALPSGDPVPEPSFNDIDGDGSAYSDGDLVQAEITCTFDLMTPLAENVLGGPVRMTVRTDFAVYRTIVGGIPNPEGPPPPPPGCSAGEATVPDLIGAKLQVARDMWVAALFSEARFSPAVTNSNKNRTVLTQSLQAGECESTGASIVVTF